MARSAIVTGGTRGIGEAISVVLKEAGISVAVSYISNDERARAFTMRTGIPSFRWDVADYDGCQHGCAKVAAEYGPIDILIYNAGIIRDGIILKLAYQAWQDVIDTNLSSCFNMAKAVFPGMCERKWGRIVNIGSINGQAGSYGQVNYAAAKSGIYGFTKALAQEGASTGVTVNTIAPGHIDTEMVAVLPANVTEKILAKIPVGRLGQASEIARAVAFLCSDDAGFVTGSTLSINGGQHMH
jgi:acetoacetyl-CoA reductase